MIQINWAAAIAAACFVLGGVGAVKSFVEVVMIGNEKWMLLLIPAAMFLGIAVGVICGA